MDQAVENKYNIQTNWSEKRNTGRKKMRSKDFAVKLVNVQEFFHSGTIRFKLCPVSNK